MSVLGFYDRGPQLLRLSESSDCLHKGTAMHEIGHSLGLTHEHVSVKVISFHPYQNAGTLQVS